MKFKVIVLRKNREMLVKMYKDINKILDKDTNTIKVGGYDYIINEDAIVFHKKKHMLDKDYYAIIVSEGKVIPNTMEKNGDINLNIKNTTQEFDLNYQVLLHSKILKDTIKGEEKDKFDVMYLIMFGVGLLLGALVLAGITGVKI